MIDDEIEVIESLKLFLEKTGEYKVFGITNPVKFFEFITDKQKRISLIILDLDMPALTGMVILASFRRYLLGKCIPIIVYSSVIENGRTEIAEKALKQKPYAFVKKGETNELLHHIKEVQLATQLYDGRIEEEERDEMFELAESIDENELIKIDNLLIKDYLETPRGYLDPAIAYSKKLEAFVNEINDPKLLRYLQFRMLIIGEKNLSQAIAAKRESLLKGNK